MNNDYDYTFDPNVAKNFNGFISPDGKFYKISRKNVHVSSHQEWANAFVINNTNFIKLLAKPNKSFLYTISRLKDKQDLLIHFYGYIYYSHDEYSKKPILIYPDFDINNMSVTKEQKDILFKVMLLNYEEEYYPEYAKEYEDSEKHNEYVDRLISKRLEEEIKK